MMRSPWKSPLSVRSIVALLVCLGCGGDAPDMYDGPEWLTELEYRFTGTAEQGVLFNWASVRADPYRDRIFVLDARETQVSTWWPDGSLVFAVGRKGEGPGEFTRPSRIYFAEDGGFTVREGWGTRFTHYTANGELVGTEIGLRTSLTYQDTRLGLHAPTADGGYLAIPLFDSYRRAGLYGGLPMEREPILRVRRSEGGHWLTPEPIYWKSVRNYSQDHFQVERLDVPFFVPQYFADVVHTAFAHGKVLPFGLGRGVDQDLREVGHAPGVLHPPSGRHIRRATARSPARVFWSPRRYCHPRLGDPGRSPRRALRGWAAIDAKGGTVSQEV